MDFKVTKNKSGSDVLLDGMIDENAGEPLTRLRRALFGVTHVTFDCKAVTTINSTGLRLWSEFLKSMKGTISYEYRRCSVYFVDYANMSPALVSGANIQSFFAPFRCPSCNASHELLLDRGKLPAQGFGPQSCPKCSTSLEPEVAAGSYLDFLSPD